MRVVLVLLAVLSAACSSTRAVPQPYPTPGSGPAPPAAGSPTPSAPTPSPSTPAEVRASRIVATALQYRGVPYKNGGVDPEGFDCSGFVQYVLGKHRLRVPRETRAQFTVGTKVAKADIQAGDLVFFSTVSDGASHVGIAVDADEFVHAPSSRGVVRVESLSVKYWRDRFIGARRLE